MEVNRKSALGTEISTDKNSFKKVYEMVLEGGNVDIYLALL